MKEFVSLLLTLAFAVAVPLSAAVGCAQISGSETQKASRVDSVFPGEVGVMKGVWLATELGPGQVDWIIKRAQQLGLNTIVLHTPRASIEAINAFARTAKGYGISTHAWVEDGIKTKDLYVAQSGLYLACTDGGVDHGVRKAYLDLTKKEARDKFLSDAMAMVMGLQVDAVQWDDHLGYPLNHMSCINKTNKQALMENLTAVVNELAARVRATKPGMKLIFSHHNETWSKRRYLADWRGWKIDAMITQAYVSKSFGTEIGKARAAGVDAMGILSTDSAIVANTRAALSAGLSVVYFKMPNQHLSELAALLKSKGTNPTATPVGGAPGVSPGATVGDDPTPSGSDAPIDPQDPYDPSVSADADTGVDTGADRSADRSADTDTGCARISAQQKQVWISACARATADIENTKTQCELSACRATGGGNACARVPRFQKNHFCTEMLPRMR